MRSRLIHIAATCLCAAVLSAVVAPAASGQVQVEATVNSTNIGMQERLVLTLIVENASFDAIEVPDLPRTAGLAALQTVPSTAHDVVVSNGEMSERVRYVWTFRPIAEGTARIEPIAVRVDKALHYTEAIRVNVAGQPQRAADRAGARLYDDVFGSDDIFIRAIPSKTSVYLHEQVVIEYRLYFREGVQLRQSRLAGSWDAPGFWREELDVDLRPVPERQVTNGLSYQTIVLKRVAMFPTREGRLTVQPLRIETEARPRYGGDMFDAFLAYRNRFRSIELASPEVSIDVRPLPTGAPQDFGGAVGSFAVDIRATDTVLKPGDPLTRRLDIRGSGNIAMIESPPAPVPDGVEALAPRVQEAVERGGAALRGRKTFDYVAVPAETGSFRLPSLSFTYFDPSDEQYHTIESTSILVEVTGNSDAAHARRTNPDARDVLARNASWQEPAMPLFRTPWAYAPAAGALLAWLLVPAVAGARRRRREAQGRVGRHRRVDRWEASITRIEQFSDDAAALHQIQALLGEIVAALVGGGEKTPASDQLRALDAHPEGGRFQSLRQASVLIEQSRYAPRRSGAVNRERLTELVREGIRETTRSVLER